MYRLQDLETGEFFVMGDSSLPVDIVSSLFNNQDDFLGSKSYSGKLPLKPNQAIIKNAQMINSSNKGRKRMVMQWFDYLPWKEAKMTLRVVGSEIEYELLIDSAIIAKQLKTRKLNELGVANEPLLSFNTRQDYLDYLNLTVTSEPGSMPMVFFPYKNDGAYNDIPADEQGKYPDITFPVSIIINRWFVNIGTGVGTFKVDMLAGDNSHTETPFFYLAYVVKRVLKYFGYTSAGSWLESTIAKRTTIFSNIAIYSTTITDYTYYMPAMSVADFLKAIRTEFGLMIAFDQTNKVCRIESIYQLLANGPVVDLRGKQLKNTYQETGTSSDAFTISQAAEDKDQAYTEDEKKDLPVLNIGDMSGESEVQDIDLSSVITKMINEATPTNAWAGSWRVPYIKMPVYPNTPLDQISPVRIQDRNNFKLRFLYYHGMQLDSAGYYYPYGSSDHLNRLGLPLTDFSLAINVNSSVYSSLRFYYNFISASKPFQLDFILSRQDLLQLQPGSRILVQDFDMSTAICLFDVTSADLGKATEILARVTLYPHVLPDNVSEVTDIDVPEPEEPEPPVDNGPVFAKMEFRNVSNESKPYPPPAYQVHNMDIYVMFFADAAGTVPKNVVDLDIRYKILFREAFGKPPVETTIPKTVTSATNPATGKAEVEVSHQAPQSTTQGGQFRSWDYELMPGAKYTVI